MDQPGFKESERQQSELAKVRKGYELSASLLRAKDMLKGAKDKRQNVFTSKASIELTQEIRQIEAVIDDLESRIRAHHNQPEAA